MEQFLITARSITFAQRMEQALQRAGIRGEIFRAPMELTEDRGCAYVVEVRGAVLSAARKVLIEAGLGPVVIYAVEPSGYREVQL